MPYKLIVILLLIAILASLGSALYYLVVDRGHGERVLRALTVRIALSIGLVLLLIIGLATGFLVPPL